MLIQILATEVEAALARILERTKKFERWRVSYYKKRILKILIGKQAQNCLLFFRFKFSKTFQKEIFFFVRYSFITRV
ncbi:hypothetical protein Q655_01372 [Bartonella henselae JK 51]|nr:hypothetical protein Q654_01424 [Bartonella henselae JK 50]ETS06149.1 hypothetical protein Q655_01372 [Bartonella henselae JK 51]OLL45072.1 hypothetical protein AT242_07870 [Bartonella henselae]